MAEKIKYTIFACILALLCLPALQGILRVVPSEPLEGDFIPAPKPALTLSSWLDMDFQSAYEIFLEENLGFHNSFVRLNNQMDFSLFRKANAEGVVVGKEGQLFESDYIRAYLGKDFVGYGIIDRKARRIKFLQEYLKREFDLDFLIVLEPGKASLYPEYIPGRFDTGNRTKTNYEAYTEKFDEYRVKYIDFNKYFREIKDRFEYPAFTKNGIHWSIYAMTFAADSLLRYIEKQRNIKLGKAIIKDWEVTDKPRRTDNDVSKTLNLIREPEIQATAYPHYGFREVKGQVKPMVLVIGDSFYWNIFNTGIPKYLFNNEAFWFFYKKVYPDFYYEPTYVSDLDLKEEIEKQDLVILTITERFQYIFDWRLIEQLFEIYGVRSPYDPIYRYQNDILNYSDWFNDVLRLARLRQTSNEDMLYQEALFAMVKDDPYTYHTLFGIEHQVRAIHEDPEWLAYVRQQANEKGISLEECLLDNAQYMFQNNYPEAFKKYQYMQTTINYIKTDSIWLSHVKEKSRRFYIPLEEMLMIEADYLFQLKDH
jgi:hypothetical protein